MDKMNFWQQQHELWKESGLSQRDFCKLNCLPYSAFCRWRSKPLQAQLATSTTKITLVPATVMPPQPAPVPDNYMELCSPCGWKVIIASGMGERFLTRLLDRLS
ncbi:IS66 family insertion sequence element accessory protein TnpA [Aeromonas hydrophila]|uniref:IS66 family insertion sequence element accessory protein TnpA n=1 Tax=Aeromonas hydrophila TaxID=644 RepID=UPI00190F300A|nr:hypothetical protein [Aeromonas hydrophila]